MDIIKASGEKQTFDYKKYCRSVRQAGAPTAVVTKVCSLVEKEVVANMSTQQIFQKTVQYLERENILLAARYKLKSAIMELGPAGFYFEEYVAAILREYGYTTKVGKIVQGRCVSHEIDVIAEKNGERHFIEVKYHNSRGVKSDVQVAMYMYARFIDITCKKTKLDSSGKNESAWLITNTKFTKKAIAYAECMGLGMTGWRYPKKDGLEELITRKALYPVTVLPSANRYIREQFASARILFVRDLLAYPERDIVKKFGIYEKTAKKLMQEAYSLV